MSKIKVQLDEDVNPLLARDLRDRGYDAISAGEANSLGLGDRDQLDHSHQTQSLFLFPLAQVFTPGLAKSYFYFLSPIYGALAMLSKGTRLAEAHLKAS